MGEAGSHAAAPSELDILDEIRSGGPPSTCSVAVVCGDGTPAPEPVEPNSPSFPGLKAPVPSRLIVEFGNDDVEPEFRTGTDRYRAAVDRISAQLGGPAHPRLSLR
ncbi:hypothetical protein GCM10027087_54700 [Paractinoplanes abujensis]|uniref:Uncharacterized protein n=1 Tax=Paractinoplanes abujensis TaxID=882441 RepID=A0A7W7CNX0_9ACTN|nr:hypothetical protein [Actinoplanes abujensis]MBB4691996.1 hypothetical protein [Actinoplanes abujensis]